MKQANKTAIIIGAGPAGLTAAYELLNKTNIKPIIYEGSGDIGGISKTIRYKGNRIDIGGHRFFSKSDTVMNWWNNIMPIQKSLNNEENTINTKYQGRSSVVHVNPNGPDPQTTDTVMLVRKRLSRIYYLRSFFAYPISLNIQTITNLGPARMARIGASYTMARLRPIKDEKSLEDFFINRFGKELYLTFFKDYTEKVWGISCKEISADWGAQRIKGLSVSKAITHAAQSILPRTRASAGDINQKSTETSLIEYFLYPKFGPGQMWETVADIIKAKKGVINHHQEAIGWIMKKNKITGVKIKDLKTGKVSIKTADYYFSTMPMKDLIAGIEGSRVPNNVQEIAEGLVYRDFMTVGLLVDELKIKTKDSAGSEVPVEDTWIYIQERDVKVGRLQIFNNWSPYMIKDPTKTWIGMEYFVNEGDELWTMPDKKFSKFAVDELDKIGIIEKSKVIDSVVIRMKKTYPAYFGTYNRFDELKSYVNTIENLFLIGRNGMHRYNNQDHSMLTAMAAVDNIIAGTKDKENLWNINVEKDYHENK